MRTVLKYFEVHFPSVIDEFPPEDLEDLSSMPLDSVCGRHCARAIKRAGELVLLIQDGHGPYYPRHRDATLNIARVALDLCNLYICG